MATETPLNVDEFTAYIAQATGLNIRVPSSHASTSVTQGKTTGDEVIKNSRDNSRLPRNKKETSGKLLYGDTNGSHERTTAVAESGPVHGLSGMFSGLMTSTPTSSEDHRTNHTHGAATGSHFHATDRSKQTSGYHHLEESSEMDDTIGRKDTRRGGRSTRGRGEKNRTVHTHGLGREDRGYHVREDDPLPIPLRREERGENERTSMYTSGGTYSTGVNKFAANGGNDSVGGNNGVARTVSLHNEAQSGQGYGTGKGQGQGPGLGSRFGQGQGQDPGFGTGRGAAGGQGPSQGRDSSSNHRVVALQDHRNASASVPLAAVDTAIVHGSQSNARKHNQRGDNTRSRPSHGPPAVPFSSVPSIAHNPASPSAYASDGYHTMGNGKSSEVADAGTSSSSTSSLPYTSNSYNMSLPPPPAPKIVQSSVPPQSMDTITHSNISHTNISNSHSNTHSHNPSMTTSEPIHSTGGTTSGSTGGKPTGGGGSSVDAMDPTNINTCFKKHKVITSWADEDDSD